VTDSRIKIDTSQPTAPRPRRRLLRWLILIVGLFYLASVLALFPAFMKRKFAPEQVKQPAATTTNDTIRSDPVDDSTLQWVSPTSGEPISLDFVPSGTQALLNLRPAQLLAHSEGEKVLAAIGPWGAQAIVTIERWTGLRLSEIDLLLVALYRNDDTWQCTLRITLVEPWTQSKLKQLVEGNSQTGRIVFTPTTGEGKVVVSCPASVSEELLENGDQPAVLTRDLARLLPSTDSDRTATLLMRAKFLDGAGGELLLDGGERLRTAFREIVPPDAAAIIVSLDWRDHFFSELVATTIQNSPVHRFNSSLHDSLDHAGAGMTGYFREHPPQDYDAALTARFPAMLDALAAYTRTTEADGIALARCYLPVQAGHNLLLTSRLRLSVPEAPNIEPTIRTLAEKLAASTTLSFSKETLENSLKTLSEQLEIEVLIVGRELQLEGITKNQTLAVDLRDRPAAEILVELLRRANPDKEATSAADPRQKLVYVIQDGRIVVTTRSAAVRDGLELPKVFGEP
jgi:hypothetical protein